jgi:hypothetical protein
VCGVLWTIVVHSVFIGIPVAQSVDLCGVLWTIVVHPVFIEQWSTKHHTNLQIEHQESQ